MTFEWDEDKAQSNLAKHGVSFELASSVFEDVFSFDYLDLDSDPGETRFIVIGLTNGIVLVVVYTERADRIRIISARRATIHEENEYYRSQTIT